MSKAESFDLAILGAGPGGYVAAIHAAQLGLKVAIVEKDSRLGGTCLLRGCIPTKALLHSADLFSELTHAADHGVIVKEAVLDFAKVMARKEKMVTANAKGVEFLMQKNKITVFSGFGRLDGKKKLASTRRAADESPRVKNVIVATGSVPRNARRTAARRKASILTSDEILKMKEIPKSMLVIGSGAVGPSSPPSSSVTATKTRSWRSFPASFRSRTRKSRRSSRSRSEAGDRGRTRRSSRNPGHSERDGTVTVTARVRQRRAEDVRGRESAPRAVGREPL